jgi:hypothetical protein
MTSKKVTTTELKTSHSTGLNIVAVRQIFLRVGCVLLLLFSFLNISPAQAQATPPPSFSGGDFGQVAVGSIGNTTVTVSNSTAVSLTVYSVGTVGAPFGVTGTNCNLATLAPGQSCSINVSFTPPSAGGASATFQVYGSWGINNIGLSGTGFNVSTINGNVTIQGKPANKQEAQVFLNGAQPQYPDGNGKYGYNNLTAGKYTVSLKYDKNLYVVDTGQDSVDLNLAQGVTVNINFNLVPKPAPSTTVATTVPTTTVVTTQVLGPTASTTPTTTTITPNCSPTSPNAGFIDLVICRQSVLPNNRYVLNFTLHNGLKNAINVRNSVEINIAPGVTVVAATADVGATRTENSPNRIIWNGYDLPAGQSARLSVTLEAPATSAGQINSLLSSDTLVSAIDAVTGSRYEGRVGSIANNSGASRTSLQPVPVVAKVPATGYGSTQDDNGWLIALFGLVVVAIATGWVAQASYRNRVRK